MQIIFNFIKSVYKNLKISVYNFWYIQIVPIFTCNFSNEKITYLTYCNKMILIEQK